MIVKNRLIITGPPKSGKTEFLKNLSDIVISESNVFENTPINIDNGSLGNESIMLDYGEIFLNEDRVLELYAAPGQKRFKYIWKNLARRSVGLIILIDNRRSNPINDLDIYLDNFSTLVDADSIIIGINYSNTQGGMNLYDFNDHLEEKELNIPVIPINPCNRHDNLYALSILLSGIDKYGSKTL